tara:strand:+ start:10423 stop:10620 length:198 start_codon:yes stop_codon:yes gene_type:complete
MLSTVCFGIGAFTARRTAVPPSQVAENICEFTIPLSDLQSFSNLQFAKGPAYLQIRRARVQHETD